MMEQKTMNVYLGIMTALVTVAAAALIGVLAAPIAKPMVWALIIGIATMPHYRKLHGAMPRRPNGAAGLMVLVMTLFIVLPLTTLGVVIAQNARDWYQEIERLTQSMGSGEKTAFQQVPVLNKLFVYIEKFGVDITSHVAKLASGASRYLVDATANAAINVANSLVTLALALFILFFIYRDGDRVVSAGIDRFARNKEVTLHYLSEIRRTTTAVMVGTLFTCFIQGVLAGIAYYVADTPVPILCGILTAVAGLVPVVGTAVVWAPLAALLAFQGDYLAAILLSLWCVIVVVAVTDNVIRPLAVGAKSNIPALAVVLGAVGGVVAMGLLGLFLGPIIFAILVTVWRDLTEPSEPLSEPPEGFSGKR
jgi:predicted PurR-regulated permease PerM